ncbi:MAG: 50S ribosome-binding GTPase [Candidatus Competibacter sp.]|jgi:GTPase SAR1 family protein|nr:50S ribosome-binding GTPase [Candidatus Competibacter sp.]
MSIDSLSLDSLITAISVAFGALLSAFASWVFARRTIPRSHRVAVIGFPQAGKTSLIVALFAHYFRRGVRGALILPRGEETIRRVNSLIAEVESGKGITPTTDQDLFAFRAEVNQRSALDLLSRRYKLEIGDFPGEYSEEFIASSQPWLHNTNYFEWAIGADAFLFVIDSKKALENKDNYVATQKSAFRAAWQRIREHHIDGARRLHGKSAVLVFTKADLVSDTSWTGSMKDQELERLNRRLDGLFADLIEYFRREIPRFRTVVTSVVSGDSDERVGVDVVATLILPRVL